RVLPALPPVGPAHVRRGREAPARRRHPHLTQRTVAMAEEYIPNQLRGNPEDADGIEEYDNRLPAWWVGLFYFSIVWAVIVFVDWHVLTPRTQVDAYEEAMANAPQPVDLDEIVVTVTPETVAAGQEIWTA